MNGPLGLGTGFYEMQASRALEQGRMNRVTDITTRNLSDDEKVTAVAKELESVFLTEMMKHMFAGVKPDENFGGGSSEEVYKSLMLEEYGKQFSKVGGVGIQQAIKEEILKMQNAQKTGGRIQ